MSPVLSHITSQARIPNLGRNWANSQSHAHGPVVYGPIHNPAVPDAEGNKTTQNTQSHNHRAENQAHTNSHVLTERDAHTHTHCRDA